MPPGSTSDLVIAMRSDQAGVGDPAAGVLA